MNNGPRAKCDQVVYEAIAKALEIVVGSRLSGNDAAYDGTTTSASTSTTTSSRFNILVPEISSVRGIVSRFRRTLHVPLRCDVYVEDNFLPFSDGGNCGQEQVQQVQQQPRRQLLERWCFEYAVSGMEAFLQREGNLVGSVDPIVQLRHVCKRIVVWLRVLTCQTRLLLSNVVAARHRQGPGHVQQNQQQQQQQQRRIGFCVYVQPDGTTGDVDELVSRGFSVLNGERQRQQSSSVVTPYGELRWQVAYAPAPAVAVPPHVAAGHVGQAQTVAQPIRIQHHQNQQAPLHQRPQSPASAGPQSAPAHYYNHQHFQRQQQQQLPKDRGGIGIGLGGGGDKIPEDSSPVSRSPASVLGGTPPRHPHHPVAAGVGHGHGHTYDPSAMMMHHHRSRTAADGGTLLPPMQQQQQQQQQHRQQQHYPHGLLQRRHTGLGISSESASPSSINSGAGGGSDYSSNHQQHNQPWDGSNNAIGATAAGGGGSGSTPPRKEPERVLSGLSLALMMTSDEEHGGGTGTLAGDGMAATNKDQNGDAAATANKPSNSQRRAFHQLPPHVLEQHQQQQQHPQHVSFSPSTSQQQQQQQQQQGAAYGYAYNNHIPWQTIHPSNTHPTCPSPTPMALPTSSSSNDTNAAGFLLGSTPPTAGAFCGTPRSSTFGGILGTSTPRSSSSNKQVVMTTPPFTPRPVGFTGPPDIALPPSSSRHSPSSRGNSHGGDDPAGQQQQQQQQQHDHVLPPTFTSYYDLLHSSPFQQGIVGSAANIDASAADLRRSLFSAAAGMGAGGPPEYYASEPPYTSDSDDADLAEEMPFAVDLPPPTSAPAGGGSTLQQSSVFGASSSVASFAQKLKTAPQQQRLQFFDAQKSNLKRSAAASDAPKVAQNDDQQLPHSSSSTLAETGDATGFNNGQEKKGDAADEEDVMMSQLAEQLAEFRSFGASLHVSSAASTASASS